MWVEKWHKEFGKFSCEQLKVRKVALWLDPFAQRIQIFRWESTEELCVMTLKGVAKFKRKLTCALKNDKRNLVNFHVSSWKSENVNSDWIRLSKAYKGLDEKYRRVMSYDTEEWWKMLRKTDSWFQKWHEEFGKF